MGVPARKDWLIDCVERLLQWGRILLPRKKAGLPEVTDGDGVLVREEPLRGTAGRPMDDPDGSCSVAFDHTLLR
jgi:hypothetical protein